MEFGRSDDIRVSTVEETGRIIEVGVTWGESSTERE